MRSLRRYRRAVRAVTERSLALPPGYRKQFERHANMTSLREVERPSANLENSIQITDPADPKFGEFVPMLGYDDLEDLGI